MGNDGINILHIYGPPYMLQKIIESRACLPIKDDEPNHYKELRNNYFSKAVITMEKLNYITVEYDFRNTPCYDYLTDMLKLYPQCWMKNCFSSEEGLCGIWIGRMNGDAPSIQTHSWNELTAEDITHFGLY